MAAEPRSKPTDESIYVLRVWSDGTAYRASLENVLLQQTKEFQNVQELEVFLEERMVSKSGS